MKKDPFKKNIIKKCSVCDQQVFVDQFGNGKCIYCGWEQDVDSLDFPNKVIYPNRISFNKTKQLFKQGKLLIPTFEDFVEGLFFYSEMEFDYKFRRFVVFLRTNDLIEFSENSNIENMQVYKTKDEFVSYAHIDGKLLKDIWSDVKNANYMSCADTPPNNKEEV